jgi:hypothetical protein
MQITISSGGPSDARDVTIEDEGLKPVSLKAKSLADAHSQIKRVRSEGLAPLEVAPGTPPKAKPKKARTAKGA